MDPELAAITTALPDYEVGRELGRGSFGVVWAGRHRHLGRPVAIKQLKGPGSDAEEHASRFRREARILAQLDHPHVVGVYDYREEGDLRLLVMAHLGGGTLTDRLQAGMGPEAGLVTVIGAATALHHVHQQGVLHRDVKPDNLMFDERGVLKVTDFGVARGDVKIATAVHLTHMGQFFGTPAYVSPEQAEVAFGTTVPTIGPAADQYGLAAVYYEMLTGELTHSSEGGPLGLCHLRMTEEPRPVRDLAPTVPALIESVVMQGLARDPADRFADVEAFAVALGHAGAATLGPGWLDRSEVQLRDTGRARAAVTSEPRPGGAVLPPLVAPGAASGTVPNGPPSAPPGAAPGLPPAGGGTAPAPGGAGVTHPAPSTPAPALVDPAPTGRGRRRGRMAVVLGGLALVLVVAGVLVVALSRDGGGGEPTAAGVGPTTPTPTTVLPRELTEAWRFPTGDDVFASPVVDDDQIVVGSEDGTVYALAAADGKERWSTETGGPVKASAAVVGDAYVVPSFDGKVYALARSDGQARWSHDLGFEVVSSPAASGDTIVVAADQVYGLNVADGMQRWAYPSPGGGEFVSSPAIDGDLAVIGSTDGTIHGIDLATGTARWTVDDPTEAIFASPTVVDGVAYLGDGAGTLWAIDVATGTVRWDVPVGGPVRSSAAVVDGVVYVGTTSNQLVARSAEDGAEEWATTLGDPVDSSPVVVGDVVVVGSGDGLVSALATSDGTVVGQFLTGGPVLSSPAVVGEMVVVGSSDDAVHAVEGLGPP